MKKIIFFTILQFLFGYSFAQYPDDISSQDKKEFEILVSKSADSLRIQLNKIDHYDKEMKSREIEFKVDTFKIEKRQDLYLNKYFSQQSINQSAYTRYDEYDKLLNKYYNKLLAKIKSKESKNDLKESQRNWIAYRDAEFKFIENNFGGLFSMAPLIVQSYHIVIVKDRLVELFEYYNSEWLNSKAGYEEDFD